MATEQYLKGVRAVIMDNGVGKVRASILRKRLKERGGEVESSISSTTTHVLVGKKVKRSRIPALLGCQELPTGVCVVRADWLSSCLMRRDRVSETSHLVTEDSVYSGRPLGTGTTSVAITTGGRSEDSETESGGRKRKEEEEEEKDTTVTDEETTTEEEAEKKKKEDRERDLPQRFPTALRQWGKTPPTVPSKRKHKRPSPDPDSDYIDSADDEEKEERVEEEEEEREMFAGACISEPQAKRKRRWRCDIPPSEIQTWTNHNQYITEKLEELVVVYKTSPDDKWRAMSTTKAIQAIKKHPKEITSYEEARAVPFVGKRLAEKIEEIVATGRLRRLEAVDQEKLSVLTAFTGVHGVGQILAEQFYCQGYRSVEELAASGVLNRQQKIGVKYYHEFQERMMREEVTEIEQNVRDLTQNINSGLEVVTCGSYRRGKPTCGDVDILITHSDGCSHHGVLPRLIEDGKETGFFTDDLSIHNDMNGGGKYLGVCRLPGSDRRKHRRIDIYVTPYSEFPCMLLHFTGSAYFNRSIRSKADKMGMSLSEHSLNTGVIRKNGVKVFAGSPLPVFSERDVFKYLDIPYREPTERDWD